MKKITNIFGIIGVIATVFSSYIGFLAYSKDAKAVEGNFIHVIHWKVAQAISPSGYEVKSNALRVIPNNYEFTMKYGDSVLLTGDHRFPFSVRSGDSRGTNVIIDGKSSYMRIGQKEQIPNINCYIWLHRIENSQSSFQLRCEDA